MADKTWVRRFAWWRRDENYVDEDGFYRMEAHPNIINHMGFRVNRGTFVAQAQDVGARMYAMSALLPQITANELRYLCEDPDKLREDGLRRVFEYEKGQDSNGDAAWLITVGVATTDEEE